MADNNAKLSVSELAQDYGFAAAFFGSDPELQALIQKAVAEQWSVAKFQAEFINTNWYKWRQDSTKQWAELQARDPAEAAARQRQMSLKISNLAQRAGITLDASTQDQLTSEALQWALNDEQLTAALASQWTYQPGGTTGAAASNEEQIRQAINAYGLTVSDDTVGQWDQKMLAGAFTMDNVNGLLKNMAMAKYPGLNQYLSQGFTVRDVADPYIQSYASILEQPSSTVQLSDPLIQKALQGTQQAPGATKSGSGSTGTPQTPVAPQSLYDFENSLRQDPRWLTTKNAHQDLQTAGMGILRNWGLYS